MYEEFVKEHEKTRDAFRAEMRAKHEQWGEELDAKFGKIADDDAKFGKIADEFDLTRRQQQRGLGRVTGAIENDRRVTREMLQELRDHREFLLDLRHGIQSNTHGLLRVLDELRREDGPEPAGT
jgi:hypothetical protein